MTGPGRYRDDEQPDDYSDTPLDRLGFSSGPDPSRRAPRGGPRRPRSHRLLVGAGAATALLLVVITATELVGHQSTPTGTPSSAADPRDLTGSPRATAAAPSADVPSAAPPVIPPAGPTVTVLPPPAGTQPTSLLPPTPLPPTPLPPAPLFPEPADPSTTSAPTTPESDPPETTGAGGDQGSAGAAPTTAAPISSPEPTAPPTRAAPPTRSRSQEPNPGAAASGSAGAAPSSTLAPIPPSKPTTTGGAGADDRASQPVVHIVRQPDGTSTITVTIGDTTIGPVTVHSDATTRVPNPPVSVAPRHTVPPTSTNPPTSTGAPDTTTPAAQPPDTQTPVPGKAPPDLQTPDTASVSQTPGSDASGAARGGAGLQQTPQTTVPGKAPVDGQTPETQTPETQTPDTQTPQPQTPDTQPSDGQSTGGTGGGGNGNSGSSDDTAGATGTGNGHDLAPAAGAPSTFEVIPSPANDVQQGPARTRSRTSSGPANTIEPGGPVVGNEAALQPPVIVQTQVNLAESTPDSGVTDSHAPAGWFTAFALGALIAAGTVVAGLAFLRRGDHTPRGRR